MKKQEKVERRKYPPEFKQDAVKLSNRIGVVSASGQLDVPLSTLHKWRCKEHLPIEKSQDIIKLQEEVKRLKKELAEKNAVVEMLKKATAFFSLENGK